MPTEEEIKNYIKDNFYNPARLRFGTWEEDYEGFRKRRVIAKYSVKFHLKGKRIK